MSDNQEQQEQQAQQQRNDSVSSDAFDDYHDNDPDDFVANAKPSGGNKRSNTNTKNKQGSIYSTKHTRIQQAQRTNKSSVKQAKAAPSKK